MKDTDTPMPMQLPRSTNVDVLREASLPSVRFHHSALRGTLFVAVVVAVEDRALWRIWAIWYVIHWLSFRCVCSTVLRPSPVTKLADLTER